MTSPPSALAVAGLVAWSGYGQASGVPAGLREVVAISVGGGHCLALKADGTVAAWGDNTQYQLDIPPNLGSVTAVSAGCNYSLALKSDGTIVAWGGLSRQWNWIPAGLANVVAISAGCYDNLALKADGSLVSWDSDGGRPVPPPPQATNLVAIAAGSQHVLALRADGTVVAWRDNEYGQTDVPKDLTNVVAIAAAFYHSLALRSDGTVVAWGGSNTWYSGVTHVPIGLSNVVAIAAAQLFNLALQADGTVVEWTVDASGSPTNFPLNLPNTVAIAAGDANGLALLRDGAPQMTVQPWDQSVPRGATPLFVGKTVGKQAMNYQWHFNGTPISGATKESLIIANAQPENEGLYSLTASNKLGTAVSRAAKLSVLAVPPASNNPAALILTEAPGLYVVGQPSTLVDCNASLTGDFALDGSLLSVTTLINSVEDALGIQTGGTNSGQISVSDGMVAYEGTSFGTFTGGNGTNPLQVVLNSNATEAAVIELMRHLTFATTSTNSDLRVIQLSLSNATTNLVAARTLLLDRPPIVSDDAFTAAEGVPLFMPYAQLLANDFDMDADALDVARFTTHSFHGGQLTTVANGLLLVPAAGFIGDDSFTYWAQDGRGGEDQGLVSVRWLKQDLLCLDKSQLTASGAALQWGGIPGRIYQIQASTNLVDWTVLSTVTAPSHGVVEFLDADALNFPARFYRTLVP